MAIKSFIIIPMGKTSKTSREKMPEKVRRRGCTNGINSRPRADWAVLTDEEMALPGRVLLALLLEAAHVRRLGARDFAENTLGITYGHFCQLRSGIKKFSSLRDDVINRIARFLGMPKVAVLLAAGQLQYEDFYQDPALLQNYFIPTLRYIQNDPEIGAYMPVTVFTADPALQQFVVMLYEKAHGRNLIPGKLSLAEIAERFKQLTSPEK